MMLTQGACYWGFNKPGCFLWAQIHENGRVVVRADYKFQHTPIAQVAHEIQKRTNEMDLTLGTVWADPEMFPKPEAAAIEAESPSQVFARCGLPMVASGANRIHGWQRVHDFLRVNPQDGKPWLIFHPDAKWLIRTVPTLIQTATEPDDCEGEDYAANALRFLLASRPTPAVTQAVTPSLKEWSLGWFKSLDTRAAALRGPLRSA